MQHMKKDPPFGGPSDVRFPGGDHRKTSKSYRLQQARRTIGDAILDVDPENRAAILAWLRY